MFACIQKNVVQTTDMKGKSATVEIPLISPNLNLHTAVSFSCRLKSVITSFSTCLTFPRTFLFLCKPGCHCMAPPSTEDTMFVHFYAN